MAAVGKRYRLGAAPAHGRTLSEALGSWLRRGGSDAPHPQDFWALHRMETEKWAKVVKLSGAKVE